MQWIQIKHLLVNGVRRLRIISVLLAVKMTLPYSSQNDAAVLVGMIRSKRLQIVKNLTFSPDVRKQLSGSCSKGADCHPLQSVKRLDFS